MYMDVNTWKTHNQLDPTHQCGATLVVGGDVIYPSQIHNPFCVIIFSSNSHLFFFLGMALFLIEIHRLLLPTAP
jgi:hypothetical protein